MRIFPSTAALVVATAFAVNAQEPKLGTVSFATSCSPAAQPMMNRAVALLHSFEFREATKGFNEALAADSTCGIAYWGIALSNWSNPAAIGMRSTEIIASGLDAVRRGRTVGSKTERERAYLDAVALLYTDASTIDQRTRFAAYRDAMHKLVLANPDDIEASIFYALALAMSADPSDKTYARQLEAGAMLEKLAAKYPNHPGIVHYIIHTYDLPALAFHAEHAADNYAKIAPAAPHALHMPSHTYTRVGYWKQSITSNTRAAEAGRRENQGAEVLHVSDYLMYAYLQTCQDVKARELLDALPLMFARFDPRKPSGAAPPQGGYFAFAAMPARYSLERGSWQEAAGLTPLETQYPWTDAITYFARAVGAARSGDTLNSRRSITQLERIRDGLARMRENYWQEQTEIQILAASGWLALAEGRTDDALTEMKLAADRESATEKNAVTPGPIAPARELLAEMLLQLGRPREALEQFELTLKTEPRRYRAIAGAAKAAAAAGDRTAARKYSAQMKELCAQPRRT
jgi:tetratricopeptide (TPR) repeat protein